MGEKTGTALSAHPHPPARVGRRAEFVRRYGWRAYALPVLSALTIAALVRGDFTTASLHTAAARPAPQGAASGTRSSPRTAATTGTTSGPGVQVKGLTHGVTGPGAGVGPPPPPVVTNSGDDAVACVTNSHQQLVLVSLSKQHLWACRGGRVVASTAVTTGRTVGHLQTPLGSWRVQDKQRDRYLLGPGYRDYVHYWVPFHGDFGLHDAPWQTMPFGSQHYQTQGSHGCVHLPTATMAWLYRWARVANTVVTIKT